MSEWVTLRVGGRDDAMSAQNQCNESSLIDLYHAQASSNDRKDDKRTEKQKTKRPIRNLFISLPCPCPCPFRTSSNITITYELNCCAHSTSIHHSLRRAVPATATTTGNIADAFSWKLPTFTAFVCPALHSLLLPLFSLFSCLQRRNISKQQIIFWFKSKSMETELCVQYVWVVCEWMNALSHIALLPMPTKWWWWWKWK